MSGSTITPYTSHSTLRADDDTSECNTSSPSTPEGSHTTRPFPSGTNGVVEDVTDGDVYENMPCDESQIYDNESRISDLEWEISRAKSMIEDLEFNSY